MAAKVKPKKQIENRLVVDLQPHPIHGDVHIDPKSPLSKHSQADLADNVQTSVIEVTADGEVITGLPLFLAAQELDRELVRVWVRTDLDDEEVAIRALEAKFNTLPLTDLARARTLVELRELPRRRRVREAYGEEFSGRPILQNRELLRNLLAEVFPQLKARSLDRWACLLNTPIEVQDAFERKQLKLEVAGRVSRKGDKIQREIARRIRAGEDPKAVVDELAPRRERFKSWGRKVGRVFDAWEAGVDELEGDFEEIKDCLSSDDLPQLAKVHKFVGRLMRYIKQHPEECCSREQRLAAAVERIEALRANPELAGE